MLLPTAALKSTFKVAIIAAISCASTQAALARDATPNAAQASPMIEAKRFTVLVEGAGADVILIPGLGTPRDVWDATRAALKGSYRLHVVQIRGFGDAAGINAEGPLLDPFVTELAHYIDTEIVKKGKPAPTIIGHSLGGLSALMIGSRHPKLTGKAIIVDALPFIGPIFGAATVENIRPQAEAMAAAMRSAPAPAETVADADPGPNGQAGFLSKSVSGRTAVARWTRLADKKVTAQALYDDLVTDVRPELGKITAPLIVLYAEDASVMPKGTADALYAAQYKSASAARLVRIDDSRHFIMLDQPDKFQVALAAALAE
jgi:pimeloyl-ACP methyl ester carboxylesterase